VQEQMEEKSLGEVSRRNFDRIRNFTEEPARIVENVNKLLEDERMPFLGTDRNVLNMPGVGKSSTFRTIGLTREGRRILEFDHDHTRRHSPVINKMGKITIVESKAIADYIVQLELMGEDVTEYTDLWGYSLGETEERMPIYEYPGYDFEVTGELSNFSMKESEVS